MKVQGHGQTVEIQVTKVEILGEADPEEVKVNNPISKKAFVRKATRTSTFKNYEPIHLAL